METLLTKEAAFLEKGPTLQWPVEALLPQAGTGSAQGGALRPEAQPDWGLRRVTVL